MKVLSVCQYDGEYDGKKYTKAMLVVSNRGNYPQLVGVDLEVYNRAAEKCNGKLVGREVEILYAHNYGKYKATEIKIV